MIDRDLELQELDYEDEMESLFYSDLQLLPIWYGY